jgi:flagella basal body P-ring formation protein FlgA
MRLAIAFLLTAGLHGVAGGAEVVLREHATPTTSVVRLGDVADLPVANTSSPEDLALAAELAAVPLMPAPAPGSQRFLTAAQVRDLLAACGVDMRTIVLRGAARVAVSVPVADPMAPPPGKISPQRPTREVVADQISKVIVSYLRDHTGHDLWNVMVSPDNDVVEAYWHCGAALTISGGQAPWTGRQRFEISAPELEERIMAFAAVERVEMVAFALRPIARGDYVRATDVALQPYTGAISSQTATTLDVIVGKEAVQAIRAGAMIMTNQVRAPLLVRRGERVSVRARAAGVTVRTFATAQQDGSLGDLIAVQALEGKDRYSAQVSGLRELEVLAVGASASEVAAISQ